MFTNSNLDNLERHVGTITKTVEDADDGGKVLRTESITAQQYVNEFAGYLYRRMRKIPGMRIRTSYFYEFGVELITLVSESNGIRIRYTFAAKEA